MLEGQHSARADWYADGDANVEQGDIFPSFRVLTPVASETDDGDYAFAARDQTIVVLTQSCDIPKSGQRTLMAASVFDYDALVSAEGNDHLRTTEYRRSLARGNAIADFLIPPTQGGEISWSIVSFRDLFVVPKSIVLDVAGRQPPIRLASPYKEYLSQAFARFVMRVGLPSPLHDFERMK